MLIHLLFGVRFIPSFVSIFYLSHLFSFFCYISQFFFYSPYMFRHRKPGSFYLKNCITWTRCIFFLVSSLIFWWNLWNLDFFLFIFCILSELFSFFFLCVCVCVCFLTKGNLLTPVICLALKRKQNQGNKKRKKRCNDCCRRDDFSSKFF